MNFNPSSCPVEPLDLTGAELYRAGNAWPFNAPLDFPLRDREEVRVPSAIMPAAPCPLLSGADGAVVCAGDPDLWGLRCAGVGIRVPLVDDERYTQEIVDQWLAEAGPTWNSMASAEERLWRILGESFDRVLMDVGLPGRSGLPIVALTANVLVEQECRAAAGRGYLTKPVYHAPYWQARMAIFEGRKA